MRRKHIQYSAVSKFPYSPERCHSDGAKWNSIILEVNGSVAGVQYDRVGALWFGGVELLRMTTPEPTQNGISWTVNRDATMYGNLFRRASEAQVQVPNNVNDVYTGVIYLSARLSFYNLQKEAKTLVPAGGDHVRVMSLTNPVQRTDAWASMAISRNQSISVNITASNFTNAARAHIDLYASAHGCEEFLYTNPPDSISQQYDMCGGGSIRQIQLQIDGRVAGSLSPFPVIYTGGINPLLRRPQAGILSFNIPPYFFDITPFLGIWCDGNEHQIAVQVHGNSNEGVWNIDPVLVVQEREGGSITKHALRRGRLERYRFSQTGPELTILNFSSTLGGSSAKNVEKLILNSSSKQSCRAVE